ncbi:MAG: secretin N-terminal domain-containing protein [Candidatus Zipacnadales bacterium]
MIPEALARRVLLVATAIMLVGLLGLGTAVADSQRDEKVPADSASGNLIAIEATDVLLSEFIRMLSRAGEIQIVLAGDIDATIPTINLPGVTPEEALEAVVEAAGLVWYKKGPIYVVAQDYPKVRPDEMAPATPPQGKEPRPPIEPGIEEIKPGAPQELVNEEAPVEGTELPVASSTTPSIPEPAPVASTIEVIPLQHADCVQLAYAFGGTVAESSAGLFSQRSHSTGSPGGAANWFGALGAPASRGDGLRQAMGQLGGLGGGALGGGLGGGYGGGLGGGLGGGYGGGYGGGLGGGGGFTALLPDNIEAITAFLDDNSLIVKGPPEEIDQLRDIISILDKPVKQVEIAVKFVTITTTFEEAFGIDWAIKNTQIEVFNQGFAPPTAVNTVVRYATGNLDAYLSVLETQSKGSVVNEPRVTVQNNGYAMIEFLTTYPYFTATITYNSYGQRTVDYQQEEAEVSNYLEVMPRINADDSVTMFLMPQISNIVGFVESPDGQRIPIITEQYLQTQVRVPDGETLVLGGLITKDDNATKRHTPLLSKIPIIGKLFSSRQKMLNDSELLIFVTPRIIHDAPVD